MKLLGLGLMLASWGGFAQENLCDAPAGSVDVPDVDVDVVFFGEIHGTRETPEVFLAAVCQYLERQDREVRVALEFPTEIQASLDRFLESDGDSEAVQQFRSHPFWQRAHTSQDGRSSVAMLTLVEALRKIRASTRSLVSVTAIVGKRVDQPLLYSGIGFASDAVMAANITQLSQESKDDVILVLVGNIHARRTPPAYMSFLAPAASLVEGEVFSVLVVPESGEHWSCPGHCQSRPFPEVTDLSAYENRMGTEGAYDYVLPIGRVSSSPPAYGKANGTP